MHTVANNANRLAHKCTYTLARQELAGRTRREPRDSTTSLRMNGGLGIKALSGRHSRGRALKSRHPTQTERLLNQNAHHMLRQRNIRAVGCKFDGLRMIINVSWLLNINPNPNPPI